MTLVHFTYSAGYHRPETGGVVFMPHRKHAANETTVLPRPFTRPLVDGVVEVDLEPTSDDWLWSVTHDHDTRFYAIPDTDGVINHTELIPVAPSTLTHRIEPVWWAELRQHQQFIADYVNESRNSVREAIDTVNTVHDTLKTAVSDAERHESVAGAYSRQAQASNEQAWKASKGPDGVAQRAEDEADRAEIYRDESFTNYQQSKTQADRAETQAGRSQTQANNSASSASEAKTSASEAKTSASEAETSRSGMINDGTVVDNELILSTVDGDTINAGNVQGDKGDWTEPLLENGYESAPQYYNTLRYRHTSLGLQFEGELDISNATDRTILTFPETPIDKNQRVFSTTNKSFEMATIVLHRNGELKLLFHDEYEGNLIYVNVLFPL